MPESSLDSGAACPPSPVQILPGDADSSLEQELAGDEVVDKEDAEVEGDASAAEELPQSEGGRSTAGLDVPGSPGQPRASSPAAEGDLLASLAATADTVSCGEKGLDEEREEAAADSKSEDDGKVRELPVWLWCWPFLWSRQALAQESSWGTVQFSVKPVQVLSCSAGQSFLGGHECSEFPDGHLRTELGSHSLLHTPSEILAKATDSRTAAAPGFESGRRQPQLPVCWASRAANEAHTVPSCPCCFVFSPSVVSLSLLRAGADVEGAVRGARLEWGRMEPQGWFWSWSWSWGHRTCQGGRRAVHTAGAGFGLCHTLPVPSPAAGLPDTRCPLVFAPERDPSQNMGSDEQSRSSLAAFLLILMISQVH